MAGTPWVTLSVSDLLSSLTAKERSDFGRMDADVTVDDRAAPVLANVAAEVRGAIQSFDGNALGMDSDAAKIPPSMVKRALALARWALMSSIPGYEPSEARKLEYENAEKYLLAVARGTYRPEPSDDPVANPTVPAVNHGVEVASSAEKRAGRGNMDGL
jgi:hypothetical protein